MTAQEEERSPITPVESIPSGADPTESVPPTGEFFTREALLAMADPSGKHLHKKTVEVEGLGKAELRELTVKQQDTIRDSCMRPPKKKGDEPILDISSFRRKLVIESMVHPKLQAEDFEILGDLGGKTFNVLQDTAQELNGVTEESLKDAESDSEETQS